MRLILTIRWKVFLMVVLVAAGTAGALRIAGSAPSGIATATVVAIAGAIWITHVVARPLEALLEWSREPAGRRPRVGSDSEWQQLADSLSALISASQGRADRAESERAHLQAVMDTMADGVLVADPSARVQLANRAAQSLFAAQGPITHGKSVIEATMSVPLDAAVRQALGTGNTHYVDIELVFPQPRQIRAVVSASGEGPSLAAVAVLHDITDRVHVERVRRDFVANVSHELRTPVSGIQTMAENLLAGALEDPTVSRHFLGHILDSTRRLVALVDDLLSLARAESGQAPAVERLAISGIVNAVTAELEHMASEKRVTLSVSVPNTLCALANAESVREIIGNLVDNALKYSPSGGSIEITGREAGTFVEIQVSDHGIGIAPEHHSRVFERFYRVDRARSRQLGGTGLGLSIVKHLAEAAGGSVQVDSALGRGSIFTVRLPGATK